MRQNWNGRNSIKGIVYVGRYWDWYRTFLETDKRGPEWRGIKERKEENMNDGLR